MVTNKLRSSFVDFFTTHNHTCVSSAPLIAKDDPTLLFTNAGMVPFKNYFTGKEAAPFLRAVSAQKCVRAGGKHNDLDNVGYTTRHHTFFEMLGNFSFGDYFKEEAIFYAWEFITKKLVIDPARLLVTVYHEDYEAAQLWKKVAGLNDDKIIRINTSDNFWSMGDTGPCGPCSEIFYDHGAHISGGPPASPNQDGDRFIEIWNLVFMQYERLANGEMILLPKPSIDTGMGLERISAVLTGTHDNFEIDIFKHLIAASRSITGGDGLLDANSAKVAHRVVADHLRSAAFLISDGIMPSNEGRGYVLRRIMRRAMRYLHQLGVDRPVMYLLAKELIKEMGTAYPELVRAEPIIVEQLLNEEERFKETLGRGLKLLEQEASAVTNGGVFGGDVAFKLYDTYGFPLDLTEDILRNRSISIDHNGFKFAMDEQQSRAKKAWSGSGEKSNQELLQQVSHLADTIFLGYEHLRHEAKLIAQIDNIFIFDQTPFYAESGGQVGDSGEIFDENGKLLAVICDTKKLGGIFLHYTESVSNHIPSNVILTVDKQRRQLIQANHSATHLLHYALRQTLGDHLAQKGSLVAPEKLRFDFSYNNPIPKEKLSEIEMLVNRMVLQNQQSSIIKTSYDEAIKTGAMALFGEKYGDEVRVVSVAQDAIELCGGTHVKNSGDIGLFKIVSEGSIASGVRRIEALTGLAAINYVNNEIEINDQLVAVTKSQKDELVDKVILMQNEIKAKQKQIEQLRKTEVVRLIADNKNTEIAILVLSQFNADILRRAALEIAQQGDKRSIVLLNADKDKFNFLISAQNATLATDIASSICNLLGVVNNFPNKAMIIGGARLSIEIKKLALDLLNLYCK